MLGVNGTIVSLKHLSQIKITVFLLPMRSILKNDIVGKLCEWLKMAYGEDTLEENQKH